MCTAERGNRGGHDGLFLLFSGSTGSKDDVDESCDIAHVDHAVAIHVAHTGVDLCCAQNAVDECGHIGHIHGAVAVDVALEAIAVAPHDVHLGSQVLDLAKGEDAGCVGCGLYRGQLQGGRPCCLFGRKPLGLQVFGGASLHETLGRVVVAGLVLRHAVAEAAYLYMAVGHVVDVEQDHAGRLAARGVFYIEPGADVFPEKLVVNQFVAGHGGAVGNRVAARVDKGYSVWGGVPRYWVLREQYCSLDNALENLILDEQGPLVEEPEALFLDDTNVIAPYISIMTAIGQGNAKISRIADVVGHKVSELAPVMKNLIAMHYVRKEVPFGEDAEKSKKTLYVIDDPFLGFYYRFVVPARPLLSMDRTDVVLQNIHSHMAEHVGHIWERLCQIAVSGNNMFGHTWNAAAHWWGKVPVFKEGRKTPTGNRELEFDVVAESMDDKDTILVGECKWKSADHAERLLAQLQEKVKYAPFAKGKKIVCALFLREKPLSTADCEMMFPEDVLNNLPK